MTILELTILLLIGGVFAGLLGALSGLGGGVVVVPLLTLVFGVDIHYAIGASLLSVIATSSGAAAAYVKEGYSNIRVGMLLEIATTFGALSGALIAVWVSPSTIAVVFGIVLLGSAYLSSSPPRSRSETSHPDAFAARLRLDGQYPTARGLVAYHVQHVPLGFGLMFIAGALSGLLGIGSGAVKVLALDQAMHLPFKVSRTTSNFMIGVTAAASAGVYLHQGYIDPGLGLPVVLGVLAGALIGARLLDHTRSALLRPLFALIILALAAQMLFSGITGRV